MLFIFDLDDTLIHEGFEEFPGVYLFQETISILNYLQVTGNILAIATHNDNVKSLLIKNKIDKYFNEDLVIGFNHISKKPHILKILQISSYKPHECIYIDDLEFHVNEAKELGLKSFCANYITGLSLKEIKSYFL
jgi:FMN phosphatase YigB (HAD superfamily)